MKAASSFSSELRGHLLEKIRSEESLWNLAFSAAGLAALRFSGQDLRFASRQAEFVELLMEQISTLYGVRPEFKRGKEQSTLCLSERSINRRIREDLNLFAREGRRYFDNSLGEDVRNQHIALVLAEVFLACGALCDPREAYHLEFSLQSRKARNFFQPFFKSAGLNLRSLCHQGYWVLYGKDAQTISDFLLRAQADQELLLFEEWRVEKSVLNQVNRVVNCDSANAQRLADSSAQQREAIRRLMQDSSYELLSEALKEAAEARIQHPELSLLELGRLMDPPIGKSGMNHRLKKLLDRAEALPPEGEIRRGKTVVE